MDVRCWKNNNNKQKTDSNVGTYRSIFSPEFFRVFFISWEFLAGCNAKKCQISTMLFRQKSSSSSAQRVWKNFWCLKILPVILLLNHSQVPTFEKIFETKRKHFFLENIRKCEYANNISSWHDRGPNRWTENMLI